MHETAFALEDKRISCLTISKEEISKYLGKEDNVVTSALLRKTIEGKEIICETYLVFKKADIIANAIIPIRLIKFS